MNLYDKRDTSDFLLKSPINSMIEVCLSFFCSSLKMSAAWVDYFLKWRDRLIQVSGIRKGTKISNTLRLKVKDGTKLLSFF